MSSQVRDDSAAGSRPTKHWLVIGPARNHILPVRVPHAMLHCAFQCRLACMHTPCVCPCLSTHLWSFAGSP